MVGGKPEATRGKGGGGAVPEAEEGLLRHKNYTEVVKEMK